MSFGTQLRLARKRKGLTQKDLADAVGARHNTVSNWEAGRNQPDPDTVRALCAAGSLMLCWGWFSYLKLEGMRIFWLKPSQASPKVPYIHQRFKGKRPHRPAFRKDSADFDDDLTSATAGDLEAFSERAAAMSRVWARAGAGVLLFVVSFFS